MTEPSYKAKEYKESLKRAFLGTDEDLLAGMYNRSLFEVEKEPKPLSETRNILEIHQDVLQWPR